MRFFKTVLLSQSFSLVDIFLKLVNILDLKITSTTYLLLITGQFKFKEGQHQFSFLTKLNLNCVSVEEIPFHNWRRGEQKSKEVGSGSSLQLSTGLQSEGEFSGRGLSVHLFSSHSNWAGNGHQMQQRKEWIPQSPAALLKPTPF